MKRIKSFTVMELVISLMISGIVISIAYYSWLLVSKQFMGYNDRAGMINEYILLNKALDMDIDRAVLLKDSLPDVLSVQTHDGNIQYLFAKDNIVRQGQLFSDTFRLGVKGVAFEPVHDTLPAVKKMMLSVFVDGQQLEMIFQKNYSALELMNAEKIIHE